MDKCLFKGVDIFNPLKGKIKYYIEAFVSVYGERYRPLIEKRLTEAKYFFLGGDFDKIISNYTQLQKQELEKIKFMKISDSLKKIKYNDTFFRYQTIIDIYKKTKSKLDKVENDYNKNAKAIIEENLKLICLINKVNYDKEKFDKFYPVYLEMLSLGPSGIKSQNLSEDKKAKYAEFLNALGYKPSNYSLLVRNKFMIEEVFSIKMIKRINYCYDIKTKELDKIHFCVADLVKELDKLDVYGGKEDYLSIASEFIHNKSKNSAYVVSCLTNKGKFLPICFCKNALELTLEDLVHEMGHIIDCFVVESSKDGYYHKNGFELHFTPFTDEGRRKSIVPEYGSKHYRENKLFNEMVNEYICLKVASKLKELDKTFTFDSRKSNSIIKYAYGFDLFAPFIEKHFDKLIELKLTVDKNEGVQEYFGKENFAKLVTLAKSYINTKDELCYRLAKGEAAAYDELTKFKQSARQTFSSLEKRIDKHIEDTNKKNEKIKDRLEKRIAKENKLDDSKSQQVKAF